MDVRIALLGASNVDLLARYLADALTDHGLAPTLYVAPYGQYQQVVLGDDPALRAFGPTHVLFALDFEDLFGDISRRPFDWDDAGRSARVDAELAGLGRLADVLQDRFPEALVVVPTLIAPPLSAVRGLDYNTSFGIRDVADRFALGLRDLVASRPRRLVLDHEAVVSWHGYRELYDDRMWYLGRIRWSAAGLRAIAAEQAATIAATVRSPKKVIALDLDGTLWGGIVGEDGMNVMLASDGPGLAYREFQEELLNLRKRGVLLVACSKNDPEDAFDVIDHHPAMVLRREHFSALRIDWTDKATNLRAIADELDLGLESFVFIDNDPVECEWVRSQLPEVEVVALPSDAASFRRTLLGIGSLLAVSVNVEDRARPRLYQQRAQAEDLRRATPSLEEFYGALGMKVHVARATDATIPRIGQLTRKTNQFNLTGRRYSDAEVGALVSDPEHLVYGLSLTDRFGDHGMVGAAILARRGTEWWIDVLLLSCRVLGRTVEHAFVAFLASRAHLLGGTALVGERIATAKNAVTRDVYRGLGFDAADAEGRLWRLPLPAERLTVPAYIELRSDEPELALA